VGLFVAGLLFAYFVMIPLSLRFFMQFRSDFLVDQITLKNYIGFASFWLIASGLVFQTPLVLIFLMKTGIVPRDTLARNRRVMIVIIAIIAAVFSPPDIFTMFLMGVPLYLLFEASLWFAAGITQQDKEEHAGPATPASSSSSAPPPPVEPATSAASASAAGAPASAEPSAQDSCAAEPAAPAVEETARAQPGSGAADDGNLVSVALAASEQQAIEWQTYLESAGISCAIRSFYDKAYDGVYVAREGFGELLVAAHDADDARALIEQLKNTPEA